MPPADEIQRSLFGAWRMMLGRADGLHMLDLTIDGFWNSFFAVIIALPALIVGWVEVANQQAIFYGEGTERLSLVARFAIVDLGAWVLPLAGLAFAARRAGIGDRFVHYVVASNWASAIIIWMMLPPQILRMMLPDTEQLATLLSLVLFLLTLFFLWRVTNLAIGKGPAMATAVFCGMFVTSLAVLFGLQALLGLNAP